MDDVRPWVLALAGALASGGGAPTGAHAQSPFIATIAGTGQACTPTTDPCGDNGPASAAQLTIPQGTSLTSAGGYLIADTAFEFTP
ncbi:MAG: hypothetical protein ACREKS_21875 [Candidatus Rokuibacteriota bacterium]